MDTLQGQEFSTSSYCLCLHAMNSEASIVIYYFTKLTEYIYIFLVKNIKIGGKRGNLAPSTLDLSHYCSRKSIQIKKLHLFIGGFHYLLFFFF